MKLLVDLVHLLLVVAQVPAAGCVLPPAGLCLLFRGLHRRCFQRSTVRRTWACAFRHSLTCHKMTPSTLMGRGAIRRARSLPSSPCEHLKSTVRFSRVYIAAARSASCRVTVRGVGFGVGEGAVSSVMPCSCCKVRRLGIEPSSTLVREKNADSGCGDGDD